MTRSDLKYPKKSHRKIIRIPSESPDLAELIGIVLGDGGINNQWQLVISLDSKKDREYSYYISRLLGKLFNIGVAVRKRPKQNVLVLVCSSMNLLDFLFSKGVVRGNKIAQKIDIPTWIKSHADYERAFLKGLVDTDGCLYVHRHNIKGKLRKDIGFCFTNYSKNLLNSVARILNNFKINYHIADKNRRIYLYGDKVIKDYLKKIGSSNPRIINKYKEWKGARVV